MATKTKETAPKLNIDVLQLERELYLSSYYDFFVAAFKSLHSGEYDDNWHVKYLCDLLQVEVERIIKKKPRSKHLIVNVPPRSAKSMLVTVIFPVWAMLKKPNIKIITASHSNSLAEKQSDYSRQLINSEWFQERFSLDLILQKDNNAKSYYKSTKSGERVAFGITSNFIGNSADIIISDDIQDSDAAESKLERETTTDKFRKSLSTRLNNKAVGLIINIQQRLHTEDVTGWLLENQADYYQLIKIPSEAQKPQDVSPQHLYKYYQDGLFWNKLGRFSRQDLEQEKKLLGSRGYANMHLQRPTAEDEGVFKTNWFNLVDRVEFEKIFAEASTIPVYNFFLDTAYTKDKANDATALVVAAYLKGRVYIIEAIQVRKEFPDLVKWLKSFLPKYYTSNSRIYIEAKASGLSLIQQLRSEGGFNVIPLQTGRDSKLTRAIQQTAYVESGNVYLIKEDWNEEFLNQLTTFKDGKSGSDDLVDAFVYSLRQAKSTAMSYFFS